MAETRVLHDMDFICSHELEPPLSGGLVAWCSTCKVFRHVDPKASEEPRSDHMPKIPEHAKMPVFHTSDVATPCDCRSCAPAKWAQRDAITDVRLERARQDEKWGGAAHDDEHEDWEWQDYREKYEERIRGGPSYMIVADHVKRDALVKIAALAIAQIEAIARRTPP